MLTQSEQEVMNYAMQGIQFETSSRTVDPRYLGYLGQCGECLEKNTQLQLNIIGHTDIKKRATSILIEVARFY